VEEINTQQADIPPDPPELTKVVTPREVKKALQRMKLWKQAGPDGVLPEFLVFGRDPSIPPEDDQPLHITLAAFFTTLLSSGVIPSAWLRARAPPVQTRPHERYSRPP
jgi:hypothetical protein